MTPTAPARPLIAVTTSEARVSANSRQADALGRELVLGQRYTEAIERASGIPLIVPPLGRAACPALLSRVDGVCLSGGPDVDPVAYADERHPSVGPTEPAIDAFELALARAARRRGLPLLAICRGAQIANVAFGGTLHQHLPDVVGTTVCHRQTEEADRPTHAVSIVPGSRLAAIVGERLDVNSFHHQAVATLGAGLVATARAPDGTIEAFEARRGGFLLCVQWHAECLACRARHARLFEAFVAACTRSGARSGRS